MDVGRQLRVGNLVTVAGLLLAFDAFVEGLNTGPNQSFILEGVVVVSLLLVFLGVAVVAVTVGLTPSGNATEERSAARDKTRTGRFSRWLGRYVATMLVSFVLVVLTLILAFVPVGHVVTSTRDIDVQFQVANPWSCSAQVAGPGVINLHWTESTAAGQNYPQITVNVAGAGDPALFTKTTTLGDPGDGGIIANLGSYVFNVTQEPVTDTVVHLVLVFTVFTSAPVWQQPVPVSGCS